MKLLLADENFPLRSIQLLRAHNYDVVAIIETAASIKDESVIKMAISENRLILTFDSDFSELVFKLGYHPPAGIDYFRWESFLPEQPGKYLLQLFKNNEIEFQNRMTVIGKEKIRQKLY